MNSKYSKPQVTNMFNDADDTTFDLLKVYYVDVPDDKRQPWSWLNKKSTKYPTNGHMLRISFNGMNETVARKMIDISIDKASRYAKKQGYDNLNTNRCLNIIKNKDGMAIGLAYVWIVDKRVFNVLIDNNPDGTPRYQLADHPDYVEPDVDAVDINDSWADLVEERADDTYVKVWEPRYEGVMYYMHTPEQLKINMERMAHNYHCTVDSMTQEMIDSIPKGIPLRIEPYFPDTISHNLSTYRLVSRDVPNWVNADMILNEVGRLKTTSRPVTCKFTYDRSDPNKAVRWCTLEFDPNTDDAVFAIAMKKITTYTSKPGKGGKTRKFTMFLRHENIRDDDY